MVWHSLTSRLLKGFFITRPTDNLTEPVSVASQIFIPLQFRRKLLAAKFVARQIWIETGFTAARTSYKQSFDFPNRQNFFSLNDDVV